MKTTTLLGALLAGAVTLAMSQPDASAQTILADNFDNPQLNPSGTSLTTGVNGLTGYILFNVNGNGSGTNNNVENPGYITAENYGNEYNGTDGAILKTDGASNEIGFIYNGSPTLTLGGTVPASFTVGILVDASGAAFGPGINSKLSATLMDGGVGQTVTLTDMPSSTRDTDDDFYYLTINNANPGDVLTITPTGGTNFSTFDGYTFYSTSPLVPEPGTYAWLLAGMGTLILAARLRRRNA